MARTPIFLPEARYRQKRIRDAARLLPLLGVVLLLVPLLWTPSDSPGGVGNAAALLFVFGIWVGLVLAAFGLAYSLRPGRGEDGSQEDEAP